MRHTKEMHLYKRTTLLQQLLTFSTILITSRVHSVLIKINANTLGKQKQCTTLRCTNIVMNTAMYINNTVFNVPIFRGFVGYSNADPVKFVKPVFVEKS
jgi:hypothetical protein